MVPLQTDPSGGNCTISMTFPHPQKLRLCQTWQTHRASYTPGLLQMEPNTKAYCTVLKCCNVKRLHTECLHWRCYNVKRLHAAYTECLHCHCYSVKRLHTLSILSSSGCRDGSEGKDARLQVQCPEGPTWWKARPDSCKMSSGFHAMVQPGSHPEINKEV